MQVDLNHRDVPVRQRCIDATAMLLSMATLRFRKCFDLAEVPADWKLVRLSLDWDGRPLLLFVEGKLPEPDPMTDRKAWSRWYQTPPKAHHLVCEQSGKLHTVTFEQSQGISTFHVQRCEDGWLLGDRRDGKATVYDAHGAVRRTLDLGDASEDIQTTAEGHIWVSYFDEGVFGAGIGRQGLVCFDRGGTPLFKYGEYAEQQGLPMIADCYAMNVDGADTGWINYYMEFPLVQLRNFASERVWIEAGSFGSVFAVRGGEVIHMRGEQLAVSRLADLQRDPVMVRAEDESGKVLTPAPNATIGVAARGAAVTINDGGSIYELCS